MEILTKNDNTEIILPCLHDYRMQNEKKKGKEKWKSLKKV